MVVVAPSEVTDEKMVQAREIITGMLSRRPDLLEPMTNKNTRIYINDDLKTSALKIKTSTAELWSASVPETEPHCNAFVHEFAHLIHFALEELADGQEFNSRLQALYEAALTAGLWQNDYASWNQEEYWAETVRYWFQGKVPDFLVAKPTTLAEYDPEAAKLVEEVFGDATVPSYCKLMPHENQS